MDDAGKPQANETTVPGEIPTPRRRGRAPGSPRPPGSGRKKGTPNKSSAEMRALFQRDGPKARRELRKLAFGGKADERNKLRALMELLDRAYGRPVTPVEASGPDGQPQQHEVRVALDEARKEGLKDLLSDLKADAR